VAPAAAAPGAEVVAVKARTKFLIGGALVLGTSGYLMASSIESTGMYYLTPTELATKVRGDESLHETGVRVGARVVPGTIQRDPGGKSVSFTMTDGARSYPVRYRGIIPDTFTDSVDVVVEGRLGRDNVFRATVLTAKCASRYENAPDKAGGQYQGNYTQAPGYQSARPARSGA
jgi:cytochrome c-type biogenesis protein CcmE